MNNYIKFLSIEKNRERLLRMLKKNGEYLSFNLQHGYIYLVPIGEVEGNTVQLKVGLKNSKLSILGSFMGDEGYQNKRTAQ